MQADRDSAALVAWVLARLADVAAGPAGRADPDLMEPAGDHPTGGTAGASSAPPWEPLARLGERFALDERELLGVGLAWAVTHSLAAARAARALSGTPGLTVEVVREVLGLGAGEVEELLAAEGRLRAHALLRVGEVPGGWPEATVGVALGAGLGAWLRSAAAGMPAGQVLPRLGLGVEWIAPPSERPALVDALAQVVRDDLIDVVARWVVLGGAQVGDAAALARALAWRLRRPCLLLDAAALAALDVGPRWELLAVARRESDLREAPLIVEGAAALGPGWRALTVQPAPGRHLPAPIVLVEAGPAGAVTQGGRPHPDFALREIQFAPAAQPAQAPAAAAAAATPATPTAATPPEDAFEAVRRQAALDAARAMGRPIAIPREQLPARAVVPRALAEAAGGETVPRPEPAATPAPSVPAEAPPPAPSALAKAAPPAPSAPAEAPLPAPSAPAEAVPPAPSAPAKAAPPAPSAPAEAPPPAPSAPAEAASLPLVRPEPPAPAAQETAPPAAATAETAGAAPASAPAATSPGQPAAADPAEALPYIDVPEDAPVNDLLRLVPLAGNPRQRAELLRRLHSAKGNTQAAALLRAHTKSEHEAVRVAAEEGMTLFFGPNWNRTRAIPKPVQPPRSDDGGRGPHGAF
ncbi:MAG TPA: hypothetical protein VH877_32890 [Polyangia bacterium]|nr:hypothetical protein [Polyangia bacterium]